MVNPEDKTPDSIPEEINKKYFKIHVGYETITYSNPIDDEVVEDSIAPKPEETIIIYKLDDDGNIIK